MLEIAVHKGEGGEVSLRICGEATIGNASALREALLSALREGQSVRLSLAGVREADLTCLQILCAAHHSAIGQNKTLFQQERVSAEVMETLKTSGFRRSRGCARSPDPDSCLLAGESCSC